jgi:thiol-disulfide isomerase/thioredoxin
MRYIRLLSLIVLLPVAYAEAPAESADGDDSEEDDEARNYLYLPLGADANPVIEYQPKEGENAERPDFLYDANNGPRVVEFYAPWCPHCQIFRNHYITFGDQLQKLALQQKEKVDVKIYAISCSVHKSVCLDFGVETYPGLRIFAAGATNATAAVNYWELHAFDALKTLGLQTSALNLELPKPSERSFRMSRPTAPVTNVTVRTKQNIYDDAWLAFDFAMKNGVFTNGLGPLNNQTQTHLRDWLDLMHFALPPSWQLQNLVKALQDNFADIVQSDTNLTKVLRSFPPPKKKWSSSCTHGDPLAGYTCGLWELFHLISVGVVEYNLMIANDDGTMVIQTEVAATRLRNFIGSFFGCEECRSNFLMAFDTCALNRCSRLSHEAYTDLEWIQLPIWLWETHNAVNVRLLHEKAKRESWEPKPEVVLSKQWPTREVCPKCWDKNGGWDDQTIYKFLRIEYW